MRRVWAVTSPAAAWLLAGILVVYLAMGQSPFLMALCLVMAGLVLLSRGHPLVAALPWSIAIFTNPLAIVVGGVFLLGDLVVHHGARRSAGVFALGLLPAVGARAALAVMFSEPALEFYGLPQLARLLVFAALGVLFARASALPSRRALQWLFAAYAIVALPFFLIPGVPIGSNIGRFFYVFGASILVAVAWPSRLPRWAAVLAVVAVLCVQLPPALGHFTHVRDLPATRAAFYSPALAEARKLYDPNYRFHVVTPERHWEAYYFPAAGYAITRGWYRQDDALHNLKLYDPSLTEAGYITWLRGLGVRYIFLPHAPLVASTRREAGLLEDGREFAIVHRDASWTVYQLRDSRPIVESLSSTGAADVLALDHTTMRFSVFWGRPLPGQAHVVAVLVTCARLGSGAARRRRPTPAARVGSRRGRGRAAPAPARRRAVHALPRPVRRRLRAALRCGERHRCETVRLNRSVGPERALSRHVESARSIGASIQRRARNVSHMLADTVNTPAPEGMPGLGRISWARMHTWRS